MLTVDDLKTRAPNTYLIYHYTSSRAAIEHILYKKSLLLNSLSKTHDPLEFEDYAMPLRPGRPYSAEHLRELADLLSELNRVFKESTKMMCFSADYRDAIDPEGYSVFRKGYCRSRMWSQYADGHRGLCLVFDRDALLDRIKGQVTSEITVEHDAVHLEADYITYNDALPGLSDALYTDPGVLNEISVMEFIEGNIRVYLFQKLQDYEHEQEYRICLYSAAFNSSESFHIDYGDSLEGVILGCRFPEQYTMNINEYSKAQGFTVFHISWSNGRPDVAAC